MRRFLLSTTALLVAASAAHAADLGRRGPDLYTKAPAYVETIYGWTGPYAGLNIGYGFGRARGNATVTGGALGSGSASISSDIDGITGGGQLGYNWQAGNLVYGIEVDAQGADQSGSGSVNCGGGCNINQRTNIDAFGTLRGRLGYGFDRTLLYVTGGGALTYGQAVVNVTNGPTTVALYNDTDTRIGWTVGAGAEFSFAPRWSVKAEYLYIDTSSFGGTQAIAAPVGGTLREDVHLRSNVVRTGVNYRF